MFFYERTCGYFNQPQNQLCQAGGPDSGISERIIEDGRYQKLMGQEGVYARRHRAQTH